MSHVRQQIRDAVVAAVTSLTTTGNRVYASRVYNVEAANLPCLKVYTLSENSEPDTMAVPRLLRRELRVNIEACCKAADSLDDDIDTVCKEVEEAIAADSTLGSLVHDIWLETLEIELNDGGDQPHGTASMTWVAEYSIYENDVETAIF